MISFEVNGKAAPAGSKRGFVSGGRVIITDANKNAQPWKALVQSAALVAYNGPMLEGPLYLKIVEYRLRPKSHFGKRGLNKKGRESIFPTSAPDCLKIARAIEDALSGVIYRDDSQIISERINKRWGNRERTLIYIWEVNNGRNPTVIARSENEDGATTDQSSADGSDADD